MQELLAFEYMKISVHRKTSLKIKSMQHVLVASQ